MIYLQDRQIAVIGIDHGYGNIKTANTITPTGVSVYTSEPLFHGDTLIFNGAYYRVGEGHKEFITDKATDEDFYIDADGHCPRIGHTEYAGSQRASGRRASSNMGTLTATGVSPIPHKKQEG